MNAVPEALSGSITMLVEVTKLVPPSSAILSSLAKVSHQSQKATVILE